MRVRYRSGCVWLRGDVWYFRAGRKGKVQRIGTKAQYPTEAKARKAAQPMVYAANDADSAPVLTLGVVIARYRKEKMPERQSTARGYESWLKLHIEPRWSDVPLPEIYAESFQSWLLSLKLSNKSRAEIRGVMRRLLEAAMFWRLMPKARNEMELVELDDIKRKTTPRIVTVAEFKQLIGVLDEPFRTMVILACLHGLGASEVLGLKWKDIDWLDSSFSVQRSMVRQIEDATKTPNREARLPLDTDEIEMLKRWRVASEFTKDENYIFASPHSAGELPYAYSTYKWKLELACKRAKIAAVTTHTFRHTYRSIAGAEGIPIATIKDMMRHADIRTSMNVYGAPVESKMREAQSRIAKTILGS